MGTNTQILLGMILGIGGWILWITHLGVNLPLVLVGFIVMVLGGGLATEGFSQRHKVTIPMFTTDTVPGKKIVKTLAMVKSRSNPLLSNVLAYSSAKKGLENEALEIGANAIVGIKTERLDHIGEGRVIYYMSGMAVVIED